MNHNRARSLSRRDFLRLSSVVATGALAAACVPASPATVGSSQESDAGVAAESVALSYWVVAGERRVQIYQDGIDRFVEKTGMKVTMESIPGDDVQVQQKILTSIASGFVPDVVHMDTMFVNQVAATGVLLPLEDFPGAQELTDAMWPGNMEPLILDGHTWAYPVRSNSIQYFYDKDDAAAAGLDPEAPPAYLDGLTDWAQAMTVRNASGVVERFGYDHKVSQNASWSTHAYYPLIWGYGGQMLDEEGKAAFNSEAGIKALDFWVNLVQNGFSPEKEIATGLELDKIASVVTGEWEVYHLQTEVGINLGVSPFPYPEGGIHQIPLGGRTLVMYKENPHPQEAWQLLTHVTSKEEQMYITKNLEGLTPRRDVLDDPWWDENPHYKLTLEDMEFVKPKDATPYFLEMVDTMLEVFEKAMLQGLPSEQALNEGAEKFNQIVETGTKA